ncbi:hypothetical protein MBLNU457_1588t1 [Dothideomycetes sp. NU457]
MRTTFAAAALVAIAAAKPVPQELDFDFLDNVPVMPTATIPVVGIKAQATTVDYNPTTASAAVASSVSAVGLSKRDILARSACEPQPTGALPPALPDNVDTFMNNPYYSAAAYGAVTPTGYTNTFTNLDASNNAYMYMGYTTLESYDVQGCSAKCDAIDGCEAFNIYFERDPTVDPDQTSCPNPPSTINIKCVFWGGPVSASNANNYGQWRASFQVAIAGSNGYVNNSIATPEGYTTPTPLGNAAINAPLDCNGDNTYMGYKLFQNQPFDIALCAAACSAQTQYNLAHPPQDGQPMTCQFFNTYILLKNGENVGQYCSLYNETWAPSYATNYGQYRGSDHYTIDHSYSTSNATDAGVCVQEVATPNY